MLSRATGPAKSGEGPWLGRGGLFSTGAEFDPRTASAVP